MMTTIRGKVARGEMAAYGGRPYGNGRPPTPVEAAVLQRYPDAVPEFAVKVGDGERPYHYKLDLAWPSLKVGLELDGSSHGPARRREADQRKDARLHATGWTILRVPNEAALSEETASLLSACGITAAGSTTLR